MRVGVSALGEGPGAEYKEGGLRLPPPTAIANQLIRTAARTDDFVPGGSRI